MDKEEKTAVSSCSDDLKGLNNDDFQLIDTAFDLLDLERPTGEVTPHLSLEKEVDKSECLVTSTDDIAPQLLSHSEEHTADSLGNEQENHINTPEPMLDDSADSQGSGFRGFVEEKKKKRKKSLSLSDVTTPKKKKVVEEGSTPAKVSTEVPLFDDSKLPKGWSRKVVQRKSGASAGKFDVYVFSPDGRKLRSRVEVQAYLDEKGITDITGADFEFSISSRKSGKTPGKPTSLSTPKTLKLSAKRTLPNTSSRKPKSVTPKNKVPVKKAATSVKRGRRINDTEKKATIRLSFSAKKKSPKALSTPLASPSTSSFRKSLAGRSTSTRNTPIQSSRRGRLIIPKLRDGQDVDKPKSRLKKGVTKADSPQKRGSRSVEEALVKKRRGRKAKAEESQEEPTDEEETPGKGRRKLRSSIEGKVVKRRANRPAGLKTKPGKASKLALKRVGRRPARYTDNPDKLPDSQKKSRKSDSAEEKKEIIESPKPVREEKPTSSGRRSRVPVRFAETPENEKKEKKLPKSPAQNGAKPTSKKVVAKSKKTKVGTKMMTRGKRNAMTKRNIEKEKKALEQDVELLKNAAAAPPGNSEEEKEDDNEFVTIKTNHLPESPLKETPIRIPQLDEPMDDSIVIDKTDDTSPNPFKSRYLRKKGPNKAVEALKKVPAGFHEAVSQTVSKKTPRTPKSVKSTPKSAKSARKKVVRPPSPIDFGLPSGMTMTSSGRMVKAPTRISPSPPPERRPKEESPKTSKSPPKREPSPPKQKKPKTPKPPKQKVSKTPKAKPMKTYNEALPPPSLDDRKEYPSRASRNPYLDYIMSSDHVRSPSPEDFLFDALHSTEIRRPDLDMPRRRPAPVIKVPSKRKVDKSGASRFGKSNFPASESDSDDLFDPHKENRFRKMQAELDDSIDGLDMIELQLQVTGGRHEDLSKNPAVELLPKVDSPVSMELIDALRDHDYYFRPMRELHIPSSMMSEDSNSLPLA